MKVTRLDAPEVVIELTHTEAAALRALLGEMSQHDTRRVLERADGFSRDSVVVTKGCDALDRLFAQLDEAQP